MILLQAAIGGGIFLVFLFIIFCIFGIPLLTSLLLKRWTAQGKASQSEINGKKQIDWGMLLTAIVLSTFIIIGIFIVVILILSRLFPSIE